MTEALIEEHGLAMGYPRCSNRVGVHNAECRGWIEGTMLRQSRIHQVAEQRRSRYRWNQRNRQGQQRKTEAAVILVFSEATSPVRSDYEELPEVPDIAMDAEDSCEAQVKRARTIMGLDMCVLEARDDTYDEAAGTMTNLTETCGVSATGENVAAPEATDEPNQLKTFGGWRGEPTVDDTIPRG